MLSAKIVAQKPSGRVMPAASPLQLVAAAWAGVVADHDISIITAVTRRLRSPDQRTMELIDDKFEQRIVHLCVIPTFSPEFESLNLYRSATVAFPLSS